LVAGDSSAILTNTGKVYNNAHVVGANIITVSGLSIGEITGTNSSQSTDYVLDSLSKTVSAAITTKTLTPTVSNIEVTKVYDGTTSTSITPAYTISGFIDGDASATLTYIGKVYNSADVLSATTVTVSGLSISAITGTNSSAITDYALDSSSKTVAATITAKELTIGSATANNKVYDSTTVATTSAIGTLSGFVGSETVTASVNVATFSDKNVEDGKTVTVNYVLNNGTNGGISSNYSLADNTTTANITPKPITVIGLTADSKVYDGLVATTLSGVSALTPGATTSDDKKYYTGDDVKVTGTGTGTFSDKNAGAGKTVTISGFTFTGTDAANYSFSAPTSIATISQRSLTISGIEGVNKVYDGTTIAILNSDTVTKTGLVPGDIINVSATGVFADKDVGNGKIINLTTSNTGLDIGNYSITAQTTATANITPATLTVKASDSAKFIIESDPSGFNGAIYLGLKGADTKDVLTGTLSIARSNPTVNARGDYVLTPSGYGTVNGNYEITYETGKFTIVPAETLLVAVNNITINYADPLSYTLTAKYLRADNTTIVTLSNVTITNNSVVANDGIGGSASFDLVTPTATTSGSGNINAGAYALTAANTVITGGNFNNPIVVTGTLTVSPKVIPTSNLVISVAKTYDGNTNITRTNATVTPSSSVIITGDNVNVYAVGSFTDGNVGTNKKLTLNAFLDGAESANYALQDNGITENIGQISQLASVSYTGASGGSWSNPSNWNNGAIPINGNVAQVVIPTGVTVVYDYESLSGNIVSNINGVDTIVSKLPTSTIVNNGGTLNIYVNINITFSNNVSGTGSVSLSGTGVVTINTVNTYSGGTNINGSKFIIENVNAIGSGAISSSNGTIQIASGIILDNITVNGPVKLASDINTTGSQTYNGGVILDAGYAVGDVVTPMTISTIDGDITFGDTLAAGNQALLTKQSLNLNAGGFTSKITFNDTVGSMLTTNGSTYADYLANPGTASIYNLNVTGAKIVINANITTFATQEYRGAVSIGDNKTNGTVRTILAEYTDSPKITFFGTIDDSTANTHDLIVKAVSLSGKGSEVTFEGKIGSIVPLKTLTVSLGLQNPDTSSKYSDIKPNDYLDGMIIKDDITTYGDQNYAQKTELEITTTLKCLNAGCSVNFFKNSSPGGKDGEKYEPKGYVPVPPTIPNVINAAYETTDLQRFSSRIATEMGGKSDDKISTGGSISVVFCGAGDDLMDRLRAKCEDI